MRGRSFARNFAFGGDYSLFAKFNNYNEFYPHFQYNNFDIGVQITGPAFRRQRVKAKERRSAADAAHAYAQADQIRDIADEQISQLQRSMTELTAQQRVTQLQAELAQEQLDAIQTQLNNGSGSPNGTQLTPKDEQQARIQERQRYEDVLDADFCSFACGAESAAIDGKHRDWAKWGQNNRASAHFE